MSLDELNAEALTAAHLAVENELVERRDARIGMLGFGNGLVVREYDGKDSAIVRMGTREALSIGIAAYLQAQAEDGEAGDG